MSFHFDLVISTDRGALLRVLALAERRGFAIESIHSRPTPDGRWIEASLGGSSHPRSPAILAKQFERLIEVSSVSVNTPRGVGVRS